MKQTLKQLKKKFDNKTIELVEDAALADKTGSSTSMMQMVNIIFYIVTEERFRENKTYKDSDAKTYVKDRFFITLATYNNLRKAFNNFEADSLRYGPGLIASIEKNCGSVNIKNILNEINKADSKLKRPITRGKIQTIVDKYKKSTIEAASKPEVTEPDWRNMYESKKKDVIIAYEKLSENEEQIERQKKTIKRLANKPGTIENNDGEVETLRIENDQLKKENDSLALENSRLVKNNNVLTIKVKKLENFKKEVSKITKALKAA